MQQNLREEEATWKKLAGFSKKIKPEQSGMEEEGEDRSQAPRRGRKAA